MDSYAAALKVYNYAKASGQGGGLDAVVGEMGQRFARKPRKVKAQEGTHFRDRRTALLSG